MAGILIQGDSFSETLTLSDLPQNLDFVRVSITQKSKLVGELWFDPEDIQSNKDVTIEIPHTVTLRLSPNEHLVFSVSYKTKDDAVFSSLVNTSVLVRSRPNIKPMERTP